MPVVQVDPQQYIGAADLFYDTNRGVVDAVSTLVDGLAAGSTMAGSDSGGVSWAASYDPAAASAVSAAADLGNAIGRIGDLLNRTGANHAGADASSTVGGPPQYPGQNGYGSRAEEIYTGSPPSAVGGSGGEPHGWFLVAHLLEYTWPNGHQDQLRSVGSAWKTASSNFSLWAPSMTEAGGLTAEQTSPEAPAATQACNDLASHLSDLGTLCGQLGDACNDYAHHLDDAHHDVISELESLIEWTIGIEAAGGLFSVVTLGGSEAAAQAAEAARIAATATRVGEILGRFVDAAAAVARTIASVASRIAEIASKAKSFLALKVRTALTTLAKLFPREMEAMEGGPGAWTAVNESMSARAAAYQEQITGRSGSAYLVDGVKFDGYEGGTLVDAKGPGYATFVRNGKFQPFFKGAKSLVDQGFRQVAASEGAPIVWRVAEKDAADAMRNLLEQEGLPITVEYVPPTGG